MTDRYRSLLVVLEHEIRADDAQDLIRFISMLKGVLSVKGNVTDMVSVTAMTSAKAELYRKIEEYLRY